MKPLIIYHGGCPDGFCAAWVAYSALGGAELLAANYGTEPPLEALVGDWRRVYILDFSYPLLEMERLANAAASLVILDHHKTAQATLAALKIPRGHAVFDMERSGAGIAWDYFHGSNLADFPISGGRPWLVRYVQDRDLWRWELEESKSVSAYVMAQPHTIEAWDVLAATPLEKVIEYGKAIRLHVEHYIDLVVSNARIGQLTYHLSVPWPCIVVNAPMPNISDVLSRLLEQHLGVDLAVGWWARGDNKYQYSLRSRPSLDCSEIAKSFGGGGHAQAAGFESDRLVHT